MLTQRVEVGCVGVVDFLCCTQVKPPATQSCTFENECEDIQCKSEESGEKQGQLVCKLQMEDPSPVIAYKSCGAKNENHPLLKEENFFLVIIASSYGMR